MPIIEIRPAGSPFSAVIGGRSEFGVGDEPWAEGAFHVFPPVVVSGLFLDELGDDVDVRMETLASSATGTLFRYQVDQKSEFATSMSDKERIVHTVDALLRALGETAVGAFKETWGSL